MKGGPLRWVVAFFTRPIHLSDLSAFVRSLKPRRKLKVEAKNAGAGEGAGAEADRSARPRAKAVAGARPPVAQLRDPSLDVAVTDVPLDTLPAELQSEFGVTTSPTPLDPPSPRSSGAEG